MDSKPSTCHVFILYTVGHVNVNVKLQPIVFGYFNIRNIVEDPIPTVECCLSLLV